MIIDKQFPIIGTFVTVVYLPRYVSKCLSASQIIEMTNKGFLKCILTFLT